MAILVWDCSSVGSLRSCREVQLVLDMRILKQRVALSLFISRQGDLNTNQRNYRRKRRRDRLNWRINLQWATSMSDLILMLFRCLSWNFQSPRWLIPRLLSVGSTDIFIVLAFPSFNDIKDYNNVSKISVLTNSVTKLIPALTFVWIVVKKQKLIRRTWMELWGWMLKGQNLSQNFESKPRTRRKYWARAKAATWYEIVNLFLRKYGVRDLISKSGFWSLECLVGECLVVYAIGWTN